MYMRRCHVAVFCRNINNIALAQGRKRLRNKTFRRRDVGRLKLIRQRTAWPNVSFPMFINELCIFGANKICHSLLSTLLLTGKCEFDVSFFLRFAIFSVPSFASFRSSAAAASLQTQLIIGNCVATDDDPFAFSKSPSPRTPLTSPPPAINWSVRFSGRSIGRNHFVIAHNERGNWPKRARPVAMATADDEEVFETDLIDQ